uniref:Uncharacterized protein n=1 Tax=Opuntia streptacantha TaxID=393608 RepID=A0A7C9AWQ2_OPUST
MFVYHVHLACFSNLIVNFRIGVDRDLIFGVSRVEFRLASSKHHSLCKVEDIIRHKQYIQQSPQRHSILKIQCRQPQFSDPALPYVPTTTGSSGPNPIQLLFPKQIHQIRLRRWALGFLSVSEKGPPMAG